MFKGQAAASGNVDPAGGKISAEAIDAAYKEALMKLQPAKPEDEVKVDRLLMESLSDPHVMDKIVEKLGRDPNYAKKVKK